jgi:8-oxo-dGTP pyrophosphatase MutT (NUDIX family)
MNCKHCGSKQINQILDQEKVIYHCFNCGKNSGTAVVFDGKIKAELLDGQMVHFSAGAIIEKNNHFLIGKKRTYDYKYHFIAGHREFEETARNALEREVFEETGIIFKEANLVFSGVIEDDPCRMGVKRHFWDFYHIKTDQEPIANSEFEFLSWYKREEIAQLDLSDITKTLWRKFINYE